jgi:hypothetical protein
MSFWKRPARESLQDKIRNEVIRKRGSSKIKNERTKR